MRLLTTIFVTSIYLVVPCALGDEISWLNVDPTLLSSESPTLVTATTTGPRFYTTPEPPVFRVGLTQNGDPLINVDPLTVSRTELTFRVPALAAGFYGFMVRVQDPNTLQWSVVYRSADRFFRVAADTNLRQVFNTFDLMQPENQLHPREFLTTTQCVVRGVISGIRSMGQHVNDGPGSLDLNWTKNFDYDGEGDCGIKFGFDCMLDGYSMFNFSIPFEMVIDFPTKVHAGQEIRFAPRTFQYPGGDCFTNSHSLDFSTAHNLMVNVPFDTLPALDISLVQLPDRLQVMGSVPILPWESYDLGVIEIGWPFDDGQATYNGVTLKLGGHTNYTTSGQAVTLSQGTRTLSTEEVRLNDLWSIAGDQILFLAEAPIPYVQQAAIVLASASVEFHQTFNMIVRSRDLVAVDIPMLLEFETQAPPTTGPWHLQANLSFDVNSKLWSSYIYELGAGFIFDMDFIDPVPIPSSGPWSLTPVHSAALSQPEVINVNCTIDVYSEVISSNAWVTAYAPPISTGACQLANYTIQQAADENLRLANLVFPAPTLPQSGDTTQSGTLVVKPGSELALMVTVHPLSFGRVTLAPSPVDGGYSTGTVVTVTANPTNGYVFAGWAGDATGSANPTTVLMDRVKSVTANFKPLPPPPRVVAWGNDDAGETQVPSGSSNAIAVAAGNGFSTAVRADGTIQSWGSSSYFQTNVPAGLSNVATIASGWSHTLALKKDGTVVAWGAGTNVEAYPRLGQAIVPQELSNIVAVAGGATHSLALNSQGTAIAWGGRGFGETNIPLDASNLVAIAAGPDYSLGLKNNGKVIGWGAGVYSISTPPESLSNVVAIAAGWYHAAALTRDGTVTAWGAGAINSGTFPQLGQCMVPAGLSNVIAIAAGNTFNLALKRDGTLAAWGSYFSPGAGGYVPMTTPPGLSNVTAIAAGGNHCIVVVNGGGEEMRLYGPAREAGVFNVYTPTQRGKAYLLEFKNSWAEPIWTIAPPLYGDGTNRLLRDPSAGVSQRFYRVRSY